MNKFVIPRDIIFGEGSLEALKDLTDYNRAVIVSGGSSMKKFGFLDKAEEYLKEAGLEVEYIQGIEPDPSVETVLKGAKTMEEFNPDVIVAIGGGSTIDAAKAMWIFYEHPELSFDDVKEVNGIPKLRNKAILIAVPSTSGTATEVTSAAVITDYEKKVKYPLVDTEIIPDIAILDYDIPKTLLPHLVAHTGMDALTHAIEAYVATNRSSISDGLAKESIEGIYDNLVRSYHGDMEARSNMHMAQSLAGMAFSNAGLGLSHSIAHQIGAAYGIPHGCCNAILLPYVIEYNAKVSEKDFADLARMLNLPGGTDKQLTQSLIESIHKLNKELDIKPTLKENGVDEDTFKADLDYMAKNAMLDGCTITNPRETSIEDIKKILESAYYGKPVIF